MYYLLEFHMITFISLAIISLIEDIKIDYYNEYLVIFYKS